jgi:hypothetical protein
MAKKEKDPNAVALGRKGGKARLHKLTSEERKAIAKRAGTARWAKEKERKEARDEAKPKASAH